MGSGPDGAGTQTCALWSCFHSKKLFCLSILFLEAMVYIYIDIQIVVEFNLLTFCWEFLHLCSWGIWVCNFLFLYLWLSYQSSAGLPERVGNYSLLLNFLGELMQICKLFFLKIATIHDLIHLGVDFSLWKGLTPDSAWKNNYMTSQVIYFSSNEIW